MSHSEVARLRLQIQAEYEAAEQGLIGLSSGTARHDFITRKMENVAGLHQELIALVGEHEATAIVAHTVWSSTDQAITKGAAG